MNSPAPRIRIPLALLLVGLGLALPNRSAHAAAAQEDRVIVLGFDGAAADTAAELMDAGQLPNLAVLRDQGTFAGLRSSAPPESPVAWAALNTGQNPAETNVTGFVRNKAIETGLPTPDMGHLRKVQRPIEEFENPPFFTWDPMVCAGAFFGATFLVFMLIFALLLRMSMGPALVLSVLLGAVGGVGAYVLRGMLPAEIPIWDNPTEGKNFWDFAAEAGHESVVIDAAMSFNMPASDGARVLFGFGLPDARAGIGEWAIYTDSPLVFEPPPQGDSKGLTAGTKFKIQERDGKVVTELFGPVNFWQVERDREKIRKIQERLDPGGDDLGYKESSELQAAKRELEQSIETPNARVRVPLEITRRPEDRSVVVRIGGEEQTVGEREWSDFYHVTFDLNPLLKVNAVTRVSLLSYDEPFELLVNVLDLDPGAPTFWQPVSDPIDYSVELAEHCGPFETYGWPSLTMPYKDEVITPETMLQDLEFTMKWREQVVHHALDQGDWDLFFGVFSVTDRVQHMMYQFYDPEHPLFDAAEAAHELEFFGEKMTRRDVIPAIYRQMDRIVGDVMAKLQEGDTLLLCADHGFQSFRWQVHVNNWLADQGYLVLKDGVKKSQSASTSLYADMTRTRAYAMGMGYIYLNLVGREEAGIVTEAEAPALLAEIEQKLLSAVDPSTGLPMCEEVYVTRNVHKGPFLKNEADILPGFAAGYRVSWKTSLGGIKLVDEDGAVVVGPTYEDNNKTWSGGHVSVSLEQVKGIFYCNKKLVLPPEGPDLMHVAPTVLALLGERGIEQFDLPPLELAR